MRYPAGMNPDDPSPDYGPWHTVKTETPNISTYEDVVFVAIGMDGDLKNGEVVADESEHVDVVIIRHPERLGGPGKEKTP